MKKQAFISIFILLVISAIILSACKVEKNTCAHDYEYYTVNEYTHKLMCIKCNNLIIQEHTFSDITCDKCSYSKQPLDIFYYKAIFSGIEIVGLKDTTATEIIIPENVSSISYAAFRNHKDISYVFIPADVDFIGAYAFYGCTNITIYCEAYSKPKNWSDEWNIGNYPVVWDCKNQYPNNIENT